MTAPRPGQNKPRSPRRPAAKPSRSGAFPWRLLVGLLVAAALVTAAVLFLWPDNPLPQSRGACDVVVDVTGQPGYDWVRKTIDSGKQTLEQDCAGRVMSANLITDRSANSACNEVNVDVFVEPSGNSFEDEDKRAALWNSYFDQLTRLATCGTYGSEDADPATAQPVHFEGSDILTAIHNSGQQLNQVDGPKTLYVVSDMINSMPPLDGMPAMKQVNATVKRLDSEGLIPDLSGVEVRMVGVGTGSKTNAKQLAALEAFWEAYFEKANASSAKFVQSIG